MLKNEPFGNPFASSPAGLRRLPQQLHMLCRSNICRNISQC